MKLSNSFFITRRDMPKDEQTISSKLLIKSGMIIKNSNGVYSYLPIGFRVFKNIKKIIRDEFNKINAVETYFPTLINDEIETSIFEEVFKLKDRNNKQLKLTHSSEELFAYLAYNKVNSYKDLHFTLYQFNKKYRDEKHTEYGLVRTKEFTMAEAYSFDADEGGLDVSYDKMFLSFKHIFQKLSLDTTVVRGDEGDFCEEFQVLCKQGDNTVVKCKNCTYASNIENASSKTIAITKEVMPRKKELVNTKGKISVKDVSEYLDVFESSVLKSLVCKVDGIYKMILLKGTSELNVKKLKRLFNTTNIEIPSSYELKKIGTSIGYIGPINSTMEIIADNEVKNMYNFICGSNKEGYHYKNANYGVDFKINRFADLKLFNSSSLCPKCKNECDIMNGIEVGQISKLSMREIEKYNLIYTDEINTKDKVKMGKYNIGIDRCISAIVYTHHDENGIIWPMSVAPYKVAIVVTNVNNDIYMKFSTKLYDKLYSLNIDTILDDRKETIGVKFNDIDLIGIPIRVTVGSSLENSLVEVKLRNEEETKEVKVEELISFIQNIIEKATN